MRAVACTLIPDGRAGVAALSLVLIQVGAGILFKVAQTSGVYAFSQSAAVTTSEFFKLVLATLLFYRSWRSRTVLNIALGHHTPLPTRDASALESGSDNKAKTSFFSLFRSSRSSKILGDDVGLLQGQETDSDDDGLDEFRSMSKGPRPSFLHAVMDEVPHDAKVGFVLLAFLYALINNLVFVLFLLADPGTIQLSKSSVTIITALVLQFTLNKRITKRQWVSIMLQVIGLALSQFKGGGTTAYGLGVYVILGSQAFLSAVSSVFNQVLGKSSQSSLHADNMVLYGAGTVINLCIHITMRLVKENEPSFFHRLGTWSAITVIICNVFLGLAMTAVYKYADALVKCFATAVSTGILLYLSPILFRAPFGLFVLPGTILVFLATYLYASDPAAKETKKADQKTTPNAAQTLYRALAGIPAAVFFRNRRLQSLGWLFKIVLSWVMTLAIITGFITFGDKLKAAKEAKLLEPQNGTLVFESQFTDFISFIRINKNLPQRIPLLEHYRPFFHTTHYSMPEITKENNITHDNSTMFEHTYMDVANLMSMVMDSPDSSHKSIKGLFYFHFDAWIDPTQFQKLDPEKLWLGGPGVFCYTNTTQDNWGFRWPYEEKRIAKAMNTIVDSGEYQTNGKNERCKGWVDIYYVPRKYWLDYIHLSKIFIEDTVFHEIAVPTIFKMIDRTRRIKPDVSVLELLTDCWGGCCSSNPPAEALLTRRCGHSMDLRNPEHIRLFFKKRLEVLEGKLQRNGTTNLKFIDGDQQQLLR